MPGTKGTLEAGPPTVAPVRASLTGVRESKRIPPVMQPGVGEDGPLGQPKQAPSGLQSVKLLGPIKGSRGGGLVAGHGSQPPCDRPVLWGLAEACLAPGPPQRPAGDGGGAFRVFSPPPAEPGHFTHKPCVWVGGVGWRGFCLPISVPQRRFVSSLFT